MLKIVILVGLAAIWTTDAYPGRNDGFSYGKRAAVPKAEPDPKAAATPAAEAKPESAAQPEPEPESQNNDAFFVSLQKSEREPTSFSGKQPTGNSGFSNGPPVVLGYDFDGIGQQTRVVDGGFLPLFILAEAERLDEKADSTPADSTFGQTGTNGYVQINDIQDFLRYIFAYRGPTESSPFNNYQNQGQIFNNNNNRNAPSRNSPAVFPPRLNRLDHQTSFNNKLQPSLFSSAGGNPFRQFSTPARPGFNAKNSPNFERKTPDSELYKTSFKENPNFPFDQRQTFSNNNRIIPSIYGPGTFVPRVNNQDHQTSFINQPSQSPFSNQNSLGLGKNQFENPQSLIDQQSLPGFERQGPNPFQKSPTARFGQNLISSDNKNSVPFIISGNNKKDFNFQKAINSIGDNLSIDNGARTNSSKDFPQNLFNNQEVDEKIQNADQEKTFDSEISNSDGAGFSEKTGGVSSSDGKKNSANAGYGFHFQFSHQPNPEA